MPRVRTSRTPPSNVSAVAAPAAAAGAAAAAFLLVGLVDPNEPGRYPTCPFLALTGLPCPGCGSLRAMHAVANGNLGEAVGLNVLTVAALPVLALIWVQWTVRSARGRPRRTAAPGWVIWAAFALVLVFGVIRNLPIGAALAP